jgi:hypothetical protein
MTPVLLNINIYRAEGYSQAPAKHLEVDATGYSSHPSALWRNSSRYSAFLHMTLEMEWSEQALPVLDLTLKHARDRSQSIRMAIGALPGQFVTRRPMTDSLKLTASA